MIKYTQNLTLLMLSFTSNLILLKSNFKNRTFCYIVCKLWINVHFSLQLPCSPLTNIFFLLFLLFKFNIFYLYFLFYSRATEIQSFLFFYFFQFSISTSITITLVQYIFLLRQSHCVSRVKRIILLKFIQPTTYMGGYRLVC